MSSPVIFAHGWMIAMVPLPQENKTRKATTVWHSYDQAWMCFGADACAASTMRMTLAGSTPICNELAVVCVLGYTMC